MASMYGTDTFGMGNIVLPGGIKGGVNYRELEKTANGFAPVKKSGGGGASSSSTKAVVNNDDLINEIIAEMPVFKEYLDDSLIKKPGSSSMMRGDRHSDRHSDRNDDRQRRHRPKESSAGSDSDESGMSLGSRSSKRSSSSRSTLSLASESSSSKGRRKLETEHKHRVHHKTPYITRDDRDEKRNALDRMLGVRTQINTILPSSSNIADDELTKDMRNTIIDRTKEQRKMLKDNNVDIEGIAEIDEKDNDTTIMAVSAAIQHKFDRMNNCDLFSTTVELVTTTAEDIFNGKREFMGWRPNLRGWSALVMQKIEKQRLRNDMIVRAIKKQYGFGPMSEFAYDLLASAFLINKNNKLREDRNKGASQSTVMSPGINPSDVRSIQMNTNFMSMD